VSATATPDTELTAINRLFVAALVALAQAGEAEQACRLAARGWSALRHVNDREAERLNAALHSLTGPRYKQKEPHMSDAKILDVRSLVPAERHRMIFETYGKLAGGTKFVLVNDHDPKPLYYQFEAEHHGDFSWNYLEQGPQVWRVEIGRPAQKGV
jgi:uncharacterized protein (DUF2249 family)